MNVNSRIHHLGHPLLTRCTAGLENQEAVKGRRQQRRASRSLGTCRDGPRQKQHLPDPGTKGAPNRLPVLFTALVPNHTGSFCSLGPRANEGQTQVNLAMEQSRLRACVKLITPICSKQDP